MSYVLILKLLSLVSAVEFQLLSSGGSSNSGLLQARLSSDDPWGTVCGTGFDVTAANAACRSFKLPFWSASFSTGSTFTGPIVLDAVTCSSDAPRTLDQCDFSTTPLSSCTHSDDINIQCDGEANWMFRIAGGDNTGLLELKPTSDFPFWGIVCDNFFDQNAATVACRSAGKETASTWFYRAEGGGAAAYITDVSCSSPNEASLDKCSFELTSSCAQNAIVGIVCQGIGDMWEYNITGGSSGRLEARPSSRVPWGTVCSRDFSKDTAAVACKSAGIRQFNPNYYVVGDGTGPIYFDNIQCPSAEIERLEKCNTSPNRKCTHTDDVSLVCDDSTWEYQLSTEDLLLVRPWGGAAWGTVCSTGFDQLDAIIACRSLSFTVDSTIFYTDPSGVRSGPIYMSNLSCDYDSQRLDECDFKTVSDCNHSHDIFVACNSPTTDVPTAPPTVPLSPAPSIVAPQWEYRVAGGGTQGLLQVRPRSDAPWGSICGDGELDSATAIVACRSVGHETAVATFYRNGTEQGVIYMSKVVCNASSVASLDQCQYSLNRECSSSDAIGISCDSDSSSASASLSNNVGAVIGIGIGSTVICLALVGIGTYCINRWCSCCRTTENTDDSSSLQDEQFSSCDAEISPSNSSDTRSFRRSE